MNKEEIIEFLKKQVEVSWCGDIIQETLDLIDKQTKEIEFQKEQRKLWRDNYYEEQEKVFNLEKEIEELKEENKALGKTLDSEIADNDRLQEEIEQLKEVDRQICNEELITKDKYQSILKENAHLKERLEYRVKYCNELEHDLFENGNIYVVSKDKIRDTIKKHEEMLEEVKKFSEANKSKMAYIDGIRNKIVALKELLEE